MSLDTTHDCWHGAYSRFSFWRNDIATAAGEPLAEGRIGLLPEIAMDFDERFTEENYQGYWDEPPSDVLHVLLVHSDCDGVIQHQYTAALADRLEGLLPALGKYDDNDDWRGHYELTKRFISGLRAAAAAGEDVEFH